MSELTDKAPVYEIGNQTDFFIPQVKTPWQLPQLRGVSTKTLVEDNELFIFDDACEPVLSVLCGKVLETAHLEVCEEEELAEMRRVQRQFKDLNSGEIADVRKMEQDEQARLSLHEDRKKVALQKRKVKVEGHQKVVARTMAKQYLANAKASTFKYMEDVSVFHDARKAELQSEVMSWLLD